MDTSRLVMASPVLNTGAFTTAELQSQLTAAKAELILRTTTGSVRTGSSAAQSYGMDKLTDDALIRLINALASGLGLDYGDTLAARPNFNTHRGIATGATFGA